jgi:hypothetical protein
MAEAVECLLFKHEFLSSNPGWAKRKNWRQQLFSHLCSPPVSRQVKIVGCNSPLQGTILETENHPHQTPILPAPWSCPSQPPALRNKFLLKSIINVQLNVLLWIQVISMIMLKQNSYLTKNYNKTLLRKQ